MHNLLKEKRLAQEALERITKNLRKRGTGVNELLIRQGEGDQRIFHGVQNAIETGLIGL